VIDAEVFPDVVFGGCGSSCREDRTSCPGCCRTAMASEKHSPKPSAACPLPSSCKLLRDVVDVSCPGEHTDYDSGESDSFRSSSLDTRPSSFCSSSEGNAVSASALYHAIACVGQRHEKMMCSSTRIGDRRRRTRCLAKRSSSRAVARVRPQS